MNGYIKKQSLMDFCDNTASKTIDNNDIARFPVSPVVEIDRVLEIIDAIEVLDKRGDAFDKGFEAAIVLTREVVLALKGGEKE